MRCAFTNVSLLVMVKLQSIVSCGITCGSFQDLTVFTADNFHVHISLCFWPGSIGCLGCLLIYIMNQWEWPSILLWKLSYSLKSFIECLYTHRLDSTITIYCIYIITCLYKYLPLYATITKKFLLNILACSIIN